MNDNITLYKLLIIYFRYKYLYFIIFIVILIINTILYFTSSNYLEYKFNINFDENNIIEKFNFYNTQIDNEKYYLKFLTKFYDQDSIIAELSKFYNVLFLKKSCDLNNSTTFNVLTNNRKSNFEKLINHNITNSLRNNKNLKYHNIIINDNSLFSKKATISIKTRKSNIENNKLFDKDYFKATIVNDFQTLLNNCKKNILSIIGKQKKLFESYYNDLEIISYSANIYIFNYDKNKLDFMKEDVENIIKYYGTILSKISTYNNEINLRSYISNLKLIKVSKTLPFNFYLIFSLVLFFLITFPLSIFLYNKKN